MSTVLHNKKLRQLIEQCDARVEAATNKTDLLDVIKQLRSFGEVLAFDNSTPKLFLYVGLALVAAALLFVPFIVLGIAFLIGGWLVMENRSGAIEALSRDLIHKSSLLTHGLTERFKPDVKVLEALAGEFKDFRRGSYSRTILRTAQGIYPGAVHELSFNYQSLQYVDRETYKVNVPDGAGGTKEETRTRDLEFARFSLVFDFPWVKNVAVRGDQHRAVDLEDALDTASNEFNKAFCLTGANQMACAVFAKPATVLHLLQLRQQFSDVNLEFSGHGRLCLGFSDPDLLASAATDGFNDLQALEQHVEAGIRMPRLDFLLSWVHRLAELQDDNFALSPKSLKSMEH
ncbi:hypothetical protein [Pseudomonas sp. C2B4]|uniref:hypothetical protein n=1 Tax=Pseudomonas sp. C2B4 TaxID=2735270 RepID=UPI001585D739|nr:hypothetical protein [Pseudomonas sp. C2B4]NUU34802.1 hypothetical protein [Pseudomonas sp. C2B4]